MKHPTWGTAVFGNWFPGRQKDKGPEIVEPNKISSGPSWDQRTWHDNGG